MAGEEGRLLLGSPTFEEVGGGRFRCVETGHELPSMGMAESYARTKGCRLALIDAALARKAPPLNVFRPQPHSKSKLICKLTGDTINKSEQHIWKHITGKRFQRKLNQKEAEMNTEMAASIGVIEKDAKRDNKKACKVAADGLVEKAKRSSGLSNSKQTTIKKNKTDDTSGNGPMSNKLMVESGDSKEPDFWVPPIGSRWDFDNGKDRWENYTVSGPETDEDGCKEMETVSHNHSPFSSDETARKDADDTSELAVRTKRMSIAVGPSSFASRKKKSKKSTAGLYLCDLKDLN
uniref:Surfeit locus protein 2 n=1 Tax=Anthurium amnicola TaxID=1678845 RepID=A0A1D1ZKN6_9ARAE